MSNHSTTDPDRFRSGRVSGDQDFGKNLLLSRVNAEIRADSDKKAWQTKGEDLRKELQSYLADNRVKDPCDETIVSWHELDDGCVLVFDGGRYFVISVECDPYEDYSYVNIGDIMSIEQAARCDLLQGVAGIYKEWKDWQLEDVKRREEYNAVASLRRISTAHGKEFIKKTLEDDDA